MVLHAGAAGMEELSHQQAALDAVAPGSWPSNPPVRHDCAYPYAAALYPRIRGHLRCESKNTINGMIVK